MSSVILPSRSVTAARERSWRWTQVIEAGTGSEVIGFGVKLVVEPAVVVVVVAVDGEDSDVASLGSLPQHAVD